MSTASLPLDMLAHDEDLFVEVQADQARDGQAREGGARGTEARETQELRRAVAERLEQHRRRRSHGAQGQHTLPGLESKANAGWTAAKPNRIADSVAARFAKSQTYRQFLEEEAETATRQAEAAAEIAQRNAEAVAEAQRQLMEEMREWEARQAVPVAGNAHDVAFVQDVECTKEIECARGGEPAPLEPGVLVPMPLAAETAREYTVLAPSEALRDAAVPVATDVVNAKAMVTRAVVPTAEAVPPAMSHVVAAQPVISAPVAAEPVKFTLPLDEPVEPPTPIPANLIEFPRQLVAARKARPRLAEGPLREDADIAPERAQLRIFEVEADSFSTSPAAEIASSLPEWSSIRLDSWTAPHDTAQPDAQVSFALPVYAAPLERRIMAAVVDGCCVGVAFLLAVAAAGLAGDALPTGLFAAGASAVTLLLFGLGYLLLCFTLAGHTVGMRYARIALCTFGDDNPTRSAMRRRLFAMGLSAVSLGLGFAWALLDDDKLGWHDRISRMYQRAY